MNDLKSKLPDFKELTSMSMKLFEDVKKSVCEIMDDYKQKRAEEAKTAGEKDDDVTVVTEKTSTEKTVKKTAAKKKDSTES